MRTRWIGGALAAAVVAGCAGKGPATGSDPGGSSSKAATTPAKLTFPPVPPEIEAAPAAVALPPVPAFTLPDAEPGLVAIKALRVDGQRRLGTDVKVRGFVTAIYSCPDALVAAGVPRKQVAKVIANDPTRCERPSFYLAPTATSPLTAAIWVVEVPRAPTKLEKKRLPKAELAAWPAVPKLANGDEVIVSGRWDQSSPHGNFASDGLLIYAGVEHVGGGR